MKNNEKYRPLVYVSSAYAGDVTANTFNARRYCRFALEQGQIPLAPHLMFPQFLSDNDPEDRELAMFMDIILLGKCDELWVFGDRISEGMAVEIEVAKRRKQKIRYFDSEMREVECHE